MEIRDIKKETGNKRTKYWAWELEMAIFVASLPLHIQKTKSRLLQSLISGEGFINCWALFLIIA